MNTATMSSIAQALRRAGQRLGDAAGARLDAEVLLAHVLRASRTHLHAWPEKPLSDSQREHFERLLERRAGGEPVAYLTGEREFWSLALEVGPDTLIPRPDTETLVQQALAVLPADAPLRVADLGTGSGAIALALAHERPGWWLLAVDRQPACARIARRNAARLGIANAVFFVADWCRAFAAASLDAIVANPPYVANGDPHLERGDVRFEPSTALVAGNDGLDAIRALTADAARDLRPGGRLCLEHAPEQTDRINKLLKKKGFSDIHTATDLAGGERCTLARSAP